MSASRSDGFLRVGISPRLLFIAGALCFPAFLLQASVIARTALLCLFLCLNALSGKRIRVLQYVMVAAGIIACNLVIPTGRVLVSVIGLSLTEGALRSGLQKATAMTGLIALSQFSIRSDLRLPGRLGGLLGRSLFYFEKIMGERRRIDRKDIIGSIDAILIDVQASADSADPAAVSAVTSTLPGIAFLALIVCINWAAYVFTLTHSRLIW